MRNPNVPRLKIVSGRVSPQGGQVLYPREFARLCQYEPVETASGRRTYRLGLPAPGGALVETATGRIVYREDLVGVSTAPRERLSFHEQFRPIPAWLVDATITVLIGAAVACLAYLWTVEALS